jgi:hypothetical protein
MQDEDHKAADPDSVSATLERSLRRCSGMVRDYRSQLIATNIKTPEVRLPAEPPGEEGTTSAPAEDA